MPGIDPSCVIKSPKQPEPGMILGGVGWLELGIMSLIILASFATPFIMAPLFAPGAIDDLLPNDSTDWRFRVLKVIDGDAIEVKAPWGWEEKVRLLGVNAPELHEHGYREAKAGLERLLSNGEGGFQKVRLVQDEPGKRDRYGRILAYVEIEGRDIGLEMIRRGDVKVFVKYPFGRKALYLEAAGQ